MFACLIVCLIFCFVFFLNFLLPASARLPFVGWVAGLFVSLFVWILCLFVCQVFLLPTSTSARLPICGLSWFFVCLFAWNFCCLPVPVPGSQFVGRLAGLFVSLFILCCVLLVFLHFFCCLPVPICGLTCRIVCLFVYLVFCFVCIFFILCCLPICELTCRIVCCPNGLAASHDRPAVCRRNVMWSSPHLN